MVPILELKYPNDYAFPNTVCEIFEDDEGVSHDDQFTYTTRYTVPDEAQRDRIRGKIRAKLDADEAERLIALLDKHGWDVSFFVDTY